MGGYRRRRARKVSMTRLRGVVSTIWIGDCRVCVCVCARARTCVCGRACARVCVLVNSLARQHETARRKPEQSYEEKREARQWMDAELVKRACPTWRGAGAASRGT
jgi:hypothetical protein